jgi:hypothetical protein
MAYTEADVRANIAALEAGLANPEHVVQFADRSVTYSSAAEITQKIAYFQRILDSLLNGRSRQSFGVMTGKGF